MRANEMPQGDRDQAGCCGLPMWRSSAEPGRGATGPVSGCGRQVSTGRVGYTTAPWAGVSRGSNGLEGGCEDGPWRIFKAGTVGSSIGPSLANDRCATAANLSSSRSSDIPIAFFNRGRLEMFGSSCVSTTAVSMSDGPRYGPSSQASDSSWASDSSYNSFASDDSWADSGDRSDAIEIFLLPEEFQRLFAKPGARVVPDKNDYDKSLWILEGPESELDYNEWDVACYEPRHDKWVIRRVVRWWGYYEDPYPEYTDWFIEPLLGYIEDNGEPAIKW